MTVLTRDDDDVGIVSSFASRYVQGMDDVARELIGMSEEAKALFGEDERHGRVKLTPEELTILQGGM
jgi:hypothetical protein